MKSAKNDWRQSILLQLQHRKSAEQAPFQEICTHASSMFDKIDEYKSDNVRLNLEREKLQDQLLAIQQTLLVGGSSAAKTVLNKISNVISTDNEIEGPPASKAAKGLLADKASLLAEKEKLEKRLIELTDEKSKVLQDKNDRMQELLNLKNELEQKDKTIHQLSETLAGKETDLIALREAHNKLTKIYECTRDEHMSLELSFRTLQQRLENLNRECDVLRQEMLKVRSETADRMNAENEKIMLLQQEKIKKELEAHAESLTRMQLSKRAAGDPTTIAAMDNTFDILDDDVYVGHLNAPSRVPNGVEFTFVPNDNETIALLWYYNSGLRDDYLATGGSDRKVRIWRIADQRIELVTTLIGSNASITSIAVESDAMLASSNDQAIRVWSLTNFKLNKCLTGHSDKVHSAKFLGTPTKAASGSADRTVKVWDINRGSCAQTFYFGSTCEDVVYVKEFQIIVSGHLDNKIRSWDLRTSDNNSSPCAMLSFGTGRLLVTSLDVSRDGTKLLCSLRDNTIKCVDLRKMEVLQSYSHEEFQIGSNTTRVKYSCDNQLISCGSADGGLFIWNANSTRLEKKFDGNGTFTPSCCWSPDGQRMATSGKRVTIWC